jgi:myo-inositol-1(or 4)-monophosphatase
VSEFLDVAVDVARAAGALLHDQLGQARQISFKGAINLVTEMDRRAERLIIERLRRAFPDHALLAEETGPLPGAAPYRWIVDPLDGTTNYAHGFPVFAVGIALEAEGEIVLAVAYDPNLRELFVAERGSGAFLNGAPIRVSDTARLDQALLATGFPYTIREGKVTNLPEFAALSLRAQAVRRLGSAILDGAYVAAGRLDGYWELTLGPWDMAPTALLVTEAGGTVTAVRGGRFSLDRPGILATNGKIHRALLETLSAATGPPTN